MRKRTTHAGITVQAIAGNRGVFLGFDLDAAHRTGCLGFALQRTGPQDGAPRWLAGFKTFRSVVPEPDPTVTYLTRQHPVQSFYWGDYTVDPGSEYTYRVVPLYGSPAHPRIKPHVDVTVSVRTDDPTTGTHGVWFNRGVAASQAYARKFAGPPQTLPPAERAEALTWLSRGLHEALTGFVRDTAPGQALRAAVYEFTEPGVLAAFADARARGVDVEIVFHADADETGDANRAALAAAALDATILTPRAHAALAHNKFIIRCTTGAGGTLTPQAVWTGSTNMSEGGIFGHSNVGHEVRDPAVAAEFLAMWSELATDPPTVDGLRDWVSVHNPFDGPALEATGIHTVFSPRHGLAPLRWYASRFGTTRTSSHITLAFGMTTELEKALADGATGLHFVLLDKADTNQAMWAVGDEVLVAVGAAGGPDTLSRWADEQLTGFNHWVKYVHTKVLLVDPLSADPTVITGSANFSPASTNTNDENMLVIRGDLDVADVYFTEYARMFQHFYARYWAARLVRAGHADEGAYLAEDDAWQAPYVTGAKRDLRLLYATQVEGNAT